MKGLDWWEGRQKQLRCVTIGQIEDGWDLLKYQNRNECIFGTDSKIQAWITVCVDIPKSQHNVFVSLSIYFLYKQNRMCAYDWMYWSTLKIKHTQIILEGCRNTNFVFKRYSKLKCLVNFYPNNFDNNCQKDCFNVVERK